MKQPFRSILGALILGLGLGLASAGAAQRMLSDDDTGGELVLLSQCVTKDIGAAPCDPLAVAEAVGMLSPARYRFLHDGGVDSFALSRVMLTAADAVRNRAEGGDCVLNDEALYEIAEIRVRPIDVPAGASAKLTARLELFEDVLARMLTYVEGGRC